MEGYDFSDVKEPHRRKKPGGWMWNILTILVLCITAFLAVTFFLIYTNPNSKLNPFPPSAIKTEETSTSTPHITINPSWTPSRKATALPTTQIPAQTFTQPAPTAIVVSPTNQLQFTIALDEYSFVVRKGSPAAIDGSQFHQDAGCNWTGVAGQATSMNGEAVTGLFVLLGGNLIGVKSLDTLTMTGLAPQYGQGGFEITLSDKPIASQGTMWIQLVDQQNLPLSNRIYFDTYDDCERNLVIIYFDQVR